MLKDNFKHKGKRLQMVELMQDLGITDMKVLQAMEAVPRHLFIDDVFLEFAYKNNAFQIGEGQTISQPYTVAFQTELLHLKKGEKILEIGTGSGYQTAVLCEMGAKVFSIERQKVLFERTKRFLPMIGYNPKLFYGDGYEGSPSFAPFDKIIVTAAAPFIPEALKTQLKIGGTMVIPVGDIKGQKMFTLIKKSAIAFEIKHHGEFKFVPLLVDRN